MKIGILFIAVWSTVAFVHAGRGRGSTAGGSPIGGQEPQDPRGCARKCVGPGKCMSNQEIRRRMALSSATCQTCINATCGALDQYVDKAARLTCARKARQVCVSCEIPTTADEARMSSCETCLSKCPGEAHSGSMTDSGSPGSPETPGGDHESFNGANEQTMRDCFTGCVAAENCTSLKEVRKQIRTTSSACRACIKEECGQYETSNKTDIVVCIWDAKEECHECPDVTPEENAKLDSCGLCMANCPLPEAQGGSTIDSETPKNQIIPRMPEVPAGSLEGDNKVLRDCFKGCVAAKNCTSLKEVKRQIKGTSSDCRACIKEECGAYEKSKKADIVVCIWDAREDCDECPDITSEEEAKQESCDLCMETCLPKPGPDEGDLEGEYGGPGYQGGETPRTPHPSDPADPSPVQAVTPTVLSQSDFLTQLMACVNMHEKCAACPRIGKLSTKCRKCKKCTDNPAFRNILRILGSQFGPVIPGAYRK